MTSNNQQNQKGLSSGIYLVVAIIILVITLALYGYLHPKNSFDIENLPISADQEAAPQKKDVTIYADRITIEEELSETTWVDIEADFEQLEKDLQEL